MRLPASILACLVTAAPVAAQDAPRLAPSTRGTTAVSEMAADGATPRMIRLDWGQPHLRGRALHTDSLVPYGEVWRTGANATTMLHTDFEMMLGTAHLGAGSYALFTLPSADGWQLLIQKDIGQTIADYTADNDLARIPLGMRTLAAPIESLTMWLIPAPDAAQGELRMAWGMTELSVEWMVQ
jgi:hypothetical protein